MDQLLHDISGDKIVLTSTDYNWEQAEEKTVVECFECNNKQVRIDCKYPTSLYKYYTVNSK